MTIFVLLSIMLITSISTKSHTETDVPLTNENSSAMTKNESKTTETIIKLNRVKRSSSSQGCVTIEEMYIRRESTLMSHRRMSSEKSRETIQLSVLALNAMKGVLGYTSFGCYNVEDSLLASFQSLKRTLNQAGKLNVKVFQENTVENFLNLINVILAIEASY